MPEKVMVVFQTDDEPREAIVVPEWWRDIDAEDIAFLRVNGGLPKGVKTLPLGSSSGTEGLHIKTFGYPLDNEVVGERGGGEVMGFGSFTATEQALLQLSSHEITKEFSGAPIWSDARRRVIGMAVIASGTAEANYKLTLSWSHKEKGDLEK